MSITTNPAEATRRRPVVAGENKKSNVDLVNDGIISHVADKTAVIGSPGNAGTIAGGRNKDLSHSIRGKKELQKSKEMIQKKTLHPNSPAYPRRSRKMAPLKPNKPLWLTVFSVFIKNFLLFLVLAGMVQMLRKLVINIGSDGSVNLAGFSDMEGRIADVESFLKRTTIMLQLQLEAVDKKVDGEFSSLRGEMNKKFEEKSEEITSRLKLLDEKNDILEKALGHITSNDLLSKEDFAKFYEEFKRSKNGDLGNNDLSLDEIKALARQIVEKEIEKHAADGLGVIDYALATAGAMVVKHSEPYVVGKGGDWFSMTNWKGDNNDAEKMLKPSFGEPGQCFPLKGNSGFVQIKLRTAIIPEAITLEHVSKSVAYDRSSAPRDCRVYGWLQGWQGAHDLDTEIAVEGENMLLTEFTYDLEKSNAQTYNAFDSASSAVVDTIRLEFTSNHGNPSHTCIYRVRVHGHEPNLLSQLDAVHH